MSTQSAYALTIELATTYDEAVPRVKEALRMQGFGTLTEIDVTATLKDKLGTDMEPYLIIGACNPQLAHGALDIDRQVGLLLPCNVVVRAADGCTVVEALDAGVIARSSDRPELSPIAEEARRHIETALASLLSE